MAKRLTAERRNDITQRLLRNGNIKASELAQIYGVSAETIRKDLIYLEKQGVAAKSYGGAIARSELLERPVAEKEMEHMDIKTSIAEKALAYIPDNGVIMLDAGSTTYALAKLLVLRDDLTLFTNSVPILNLLAGSGNTVYSLGGKVRGSSKGIVGAWAIQALQTLHIDVSFLGTDGFQKFSGPSTASYEEAELKKAVVCSSSQTIILADHTKFKSGSLFQFCEWSQIHALITDTGASPADSGLREMAEKIQKSCSVIF